jgi:hypothetical protein
MYCREMAIKMKKNENSIYIRLVFIDQLYLDRPIIISNGTSSNERTDLFVTLFFSRCYMWMWGNDQLTADITDVFFRIRQIGIRTFYIYLFTFNCFMVESSGFV